MQGEQKGQRTVEETEATPTPSETRLRPGRRRQEESSRGNSCCFSLSGRPLTNLKLDAALKEGAWVSVTTLLVLLLFSPEAEP